MNLLDYLRKAAKSETTVYITFLQQYSKNDNSIHVFHEGKDDPSFYGNMIQNKVKKTQKIFYYQAKNKDKVYENYQKINWTSYSKKRILFFIDKDFADILERSYPVDTNIFVTNYYSIENYLVDKHLFSRSLRDLIGLDNDKVNNAITKQFQIGLRTFYEASLILTAYIIYHRERKNALNLRDVTIGDVFDINSTFIVTKKPRVLSVLDRKTGVTTVSIYKEIREIIASLRKIKNPKKYTRGKFELAYLVSCINKSPDIINIDKKKGEKKYRCCVQLSLSNAIQILAPRIRQPKDVKEFISKATK
ncbi:hypothetical protein GCM10027275_18270 [Rhabdobacter roseus]|uniref:DUF4435 domain-containing protein n=1 Tax=Rhabdobacter roseus TaxID=1655419 RepID=A0A840TUV2_9BACT|nr:DUF4435 domain-containing protein [Rhabdobacter roseus]MBB5283750.1 hypothetical protein [Rhabdobacter roseus]